MPLIYILYYFDYLGRIREGHGHDQLINFSQIYLFMFNYR